MNPRKTTIATLAALSVSLALADDFKTIRGKEYKNATINRVEPDGLVLRTKSGISKVYFTELPQDVQERFHYNAQQAAQFTSQTIEEVRLAQQQKIAADNNRAAEIAKNLELVRQQEEAEIQRQHEAKMQRQRMESQQHHRVQTNTQPTYSRSQEGIPEHTYELTQDYKIDFGGLTIRFRRGERYHGRILVDHAEIDRDGRSYTVPSGILRRVNWKIGKSSLTISAKPDGVGAGCQAWIPTGERSGLLTHTAMTASVTLCEQMKADRDSAIRRGCPKIDHRRPERDANGQIMKLDSLRGGIAILETKKMIRCLNRSGFSNLT